jgi:iron complex transport system substrate-binding protein
MTKPAWTLSALVLAAGLAAAPAHGDGQKPQRIVSMNQCTDLFVLMLAEPARIASLSFVTSQPQWTPPEYADAVSGIPVNHALAEEILSLKPDLVVTTPWTGVGALLLLRKLGYRVETFDAESTLDDIRKNILRMGELLGEQERARAAVAAFDARLAEIRRSSAAAPKDQVIANFGVNGYTAGANTLTADAAQAAGFRTLGEKMGFSGFSHVPLEKVIAEAPDVFAPSNAWTSPPSMATDAFNHPAMRDFASKGKVVNLPERLLVCGSPAALDAVDLMTRAHR